ncbi:hypothetical protein [Inconstantimicrobium mannanitabidum]|uniref:Uncharacterized protein n=1 Tax=Inconstantimicrobium mannanitabidum TaxID=1604901 RepID=A0ACB5RAZ9_9CLOT|nr:hypothetical protein [Clostridium sp. TW13]GKX66368.1 hypothetical protein rsdtw13_16260 [Clostridium sp. TW13]
MEDTIVYLLENACNSIKYRLKSEVLNNITHDEKIELQKQILSEKNVKEIISVQKADGWIGNGFHGSNAHAPGMLNQEGGLKYLIEKGIQKDNPIIERAISSFSNRDITDLCYRTKGKLVDEYVYPCIGHRLYITTIIAHAGYEDKVDISNNIKLAFDSFISVLNIDSIDDLLTVYKGKLCFRDGIKWPCIYHLRTLAYTKSWRTHRNIQKLADSINKLIEILPLVDNDIYTKYKSQLVAPSEAFINQPFIPSFNNNDVSQKWFERMELLAKCGVFPYVDKLQSELTLMKAEALMSNGILKLSVNPKNLSSFKVWGPYGGLALEENWRIKNRQWNDLTFRMVLISHYSEIMK